jgi:hypothetical protein
MTEENRGHGVERVRWYGPDRDDAGVDIADVVLGYVRVVVWPAVALVVVFRYRTTIDSLVHRLTSLRGPGVDAQFSEYVAETSDDVGTALRSNPPETMAYGSTVPYVPSPRYALGAGEDGGAHAPVPGPYQQPSAPDPGPPPAGGFGQPHPPASVPHPQQPCGGPAQSGPPGKQEQQGGGSVRSDRTHDRTPPAQGAESQGTPGVPPAAEGIAPSGTAPGPGAKPPAHPAGQVPAQASAPGPTPPPYTGAPNGPARPAGDPYDWNALVLQAETDAEAAVSSAYLQLESELREFLAQRGVAVATRRVRAGTLDAAGVPPDIVRLYDELKGMRDRVTQGHTGTLSSYAAEGYVRGCRQMADWLWRYDRVRPAR